jgi:hypothetical protein
MRNSKLISILILSVVLCITVITTASAVDMTTVEPIDVEHTALIGDTEIMPLATTSCSYCGHSSWVLSCNGAYPYHSDGSHYYSDVACSIRSHGDCTIHMRRKYVTGGTCSHEACSGHFKNPIDVGYHVETCYHTYTGSQTYNVCLYS